METPGENSITVVDPQVQTYADNNLNEKNLSTQYIYTTEGQLIPTTEVPIPADINSQHFNTVHVTEAQSIQVDYQYQGQYQDSNVQQIVPVTAAEFVQDNTGYVMEQSAFIPDSTTAVVQTADQVFPEQTQSTAAPDDYVYEATPAETYVTQESLVTTQEEYVPEYTSADVNQTVAEAVQENIEKDTQPLVENVEPAIQPTEKVDVQPSQADSVNDDKEISRTSEVSENPETAHNQPAESDSISEPSIGQEQVKKVEENKDKVDGHSEIDATSENAPIAPSEQVAEEADNSAVEEQTTDTEASEIVADQEKTDETLFIVYHETSSKEQSDDVKNEKSTLSTSKTDPTPPRKPRGRRPKSDIPLHIVGHDVNKPVENGKTPKPRLGVKVPYRTLTSQIVSKQDLEKEIFARGRKKQEEIKEVSQFSHNLTNRLAKQIVPQSKKRQSTSKETKESESLSSEMEVDSVEEKNEAKQKPKDTIDNNSDLLAILEGDGDGEDMPIVTKKPEVNKESTPTDETNIKNLEREIALQQLQDLPYLSPSTRFVKSRSCKEIPKTILDSHSSVKASTIAANPGTPKPYLSKEKSPIKSGVLKASPEKKPTTDIEVEPQIKVNMALKTYSRKRKSSENSVASSASPVKKVITVSPTKDIDLKTQASGDVYITKSSRIIKKKVIWDPDETPSSRLSLSKVTVKPDQQSPKPSPKAAHTKNDNRTAELTKKSPADSKVVKNEKKVEEKQQTKKVPAASVADKKMGPSSKTVLKPKKIRSEVDKLLGDEGAIKMLYELKTSEDAIEEKRKKTVISVEKTFKELAKRANQIKSDLIASTVETPKSLRKKEPSVSPGVPPKVTNTPPPAVPASPLPSGISRQKSKDSTRSTPPPSPSFSYPNETSYLIRRRSSSSVSSGDDTGGSMDFDGTEDRLSKKRPVNPQTDPLKIKKTKKNSESEKSQKRAENRIGHFNTFTFKKVNKTVTIDLHTGEGTKCYFTAEVLEELTTALNKISKEKDCNSVLLRSSNEKVFSLGLDYMALVSDKESVRINKATELADRVSEFLTCLLNFPKVLVAGIQGECVGLAVTILPLFDVVIASDKAHFSTPYSTLGCIAEAGFLLTMPHVTSHGLAADLFYTCQKLTADEAFRRGLISKVCWPEKYQDSVKSVIASISKGSKQSLEATKKQLRSNVIEATKEAIMSMSKELIDHWTSTECQANFASIE